ncbi:hypothetical protein NPX13_g10838 [Xylaria arbuscula]|uniref:Uncharacterized protein n=1 Tax=Xylaria arbuscula TaxID=114810 RepID=A0A9W8N409_9PEZI|nr:hypothetical protein NPX13_g10838 [Xylaria arbuscula]
MFRHLNGGPSGPSSSAGPPIGQFRLARRPTQDTGQSLAQQQAQAPRTPQPQLQSLRESQKQQKQQQRIPTEVGEPASSTCTRP